MVRAGLVLWGAPPGRIIPGGRCRRYRFHTRGAGRTYAAAARPDFIDASAALFGVLIFDTLPGLFIGIGVSILLLVYRASRPHIALLGNHPDGDDLWDDIARHPDNRPVPGIVVLRQRPVLR
jgi:sulfate permease, SulP family